MPSGERMPVYYSETQSKRQIVEDVLLRPWTQYCLRHWMSADGKPGSAEQRIKRFLDGCAYLLLRDNPEGTLTDYKEMTRGRNEIDVSSCPAWVGDLLDAGGYSLRGGDIEENARFACLLERLEERRKNTKSKRRKRPGKKSRPAFNACKRYGTPCRSAISAAPVWIRKTSSAMAGGNIKSRRRQVNTHPGRRGKASCTTWIGCSLSNGMECR